MSNLRIIDGYKKDDHIVALTKLLGAVHDLRTERYTKSHSNPMKWQKNESIWFAVSPNFYEENEEVFFSISNYYRGRKYNLNIDVSRIENNPYGFDQRYGYINERIFPLTENNTISESEIRNIGKNSGLDIGVVNCKSSSTQIYSSVSTVWNLSSYYLTRKVEEDEANAFFLENIFNIVNEDESFSVKSSLVRKVLDYFSGYYSMNDVELIKDFDILLIFKKSSLFSKQLELLFRKNNVKASFLYYSEHDTEIYVQKYNHVIIVHKDEESIFENSSLRQQFMERFIGEIYEIQYNLD